MCSPPRAPFVLGAMLQACVQLGRASGPGPVRPARRCGHDEAVLSLVAHGPSHEGRLMGLAPHSDQLAQGTRGQLHRCAGAALASARPGQPAQWKGGAARVSPASQQHTGSLAVCVAAGAPIGGSSLPLFPSFFSASAPFASVAASVVYVWGTLDFGLQSIFVFSLFPLLGCVVAAHALLRLASWPKAGSPGSPPNNI